MFLGIFSLIRFQADYLLVIGVCLSLSIANIVGFTKCRKGNTVIQNTCNFAFFFLIYLGSTDAQKQLQQFAQQTIASHVTSTIQSAFTIV